MAKPFRAITVKKAPTPKRITNICIGIHEKHPEREWHDIVVPGELADIWRKEGKIFPCMFCLGIYHPTQTGESLK